MEQYKQEFIEFMVDCNVLKFGDFTTKSRRKTPFFINTGFYRTGGQLARLGEYYAKAIHDQFGTDFDILFGPAYKGIPLSAAAVMASASCMVQISAIAQTVRKSRITEIRVSFWAAPSMTVTRWLSSRM